MLDFSGTVSQSPAEQFASQEASKRPYQPPTTTPGYEPRRQLGHGAYGVVWLGIDQSTGRKVAIKFYKNRRYVDWADLEREVKKLVLLAENRSIVQVLHFGRDADPPYYVMEYFEKGSLADWIKQSGLPPPKVAVQIVQQIAQALVHAHAKGVFHCDLKPENVLLDQDRQPCLADFGQARLSSEPTESGSPLGTLFFMAPEQADLKAIPDARWDIYALGAIGYFLLAGEPPFANVETKQELESANGLEQRLSRYREAILRAPKPMVRQRAAGVDRMLAAIIEGCLQRDPKQRFQTAKDVLDRFQHRAEAQRRHKTMLIAVVAPLVLLAVTAVIRWYFNLDAISDTAGEYTAWAMKNNAFAADVAAANASSQIARLIDSALDEAEHPDFRPLLARVLNEPDIALPDGVELTERQIKALLASQSHQQLQGHLQERFRRMQQHADHDTGTPRIASIVFEHQSGIMLARAAFDSGTELVGKNYRHRAYFRSAVKADGPHLSRPIQSDATHRWLKAISVPIAGRNQDDNLGVLAVTVNVGDFGCTGFSPTPSESQSPPRGSFVVLVDGDGRILQHPAFDRSGSDELIKAAAEDKRCRVPPEVLHDGELKHFKDPLANHPAGKAFEHQWVAAIKSVRLPDELSVEPGDGLFVIVQSNYHDIERPARDLRNKFLQNTVAVSMVALLALCGSMFVLFRLDYQPQT